MTIRYFTVAHFCFAILVLLPTVAWGKTYYVDDVSRNGNGSSSRPFNNIQAALDRVRPGDEVFVQPGSYTGSWNTVRNGQSGRRIAINGADAKTTFIDGAGASRNSGLLVEHSYYNVSGLTFRNHYRHGLEISGASSDSDVSNYLQVVFVGDCVFRDNGVGPVWAHGLYVKNLNGGFIGDIVCEGNRTSGCTLSNCTDTKVVDSRFDSNRGTPESEGLSLVNCREVRVIDCEARSNSETGFDSNIFEDIPANAGQCSFEGCDSRDNGGEGYSINGTSRGSQSARDYDLIRCFSGYNGDSGIVVYENASDVRVDNCTVVFNKGRGISNYDGGTGISIRNSVFHKNIARPGGRREDASGDSSTYADTSNNYWSKLPGFMSFIRSSSDVVARNPRFTNERKRKFTLKNTSPLIDKGAVLPGISFRGSAPDLGAFERK